MQIVAIDDDAEMLDLYRAALESKESRVDTATNAEKGLQLVDDLRPDLVFLDMSLAETDGLTVLGQIQELDPRIAVVIVTGHYSVEGAVQAVRSGATDYLCKPVPIQKFRDIAARIREIAKKRTKAAKLEQELADTSAFEGIVGRSPRMTEVFDLIQRVAPHFRTALVLGETGTGKELVARALHNLSPRRKQRLAVCNCAAIVETLAESTLFGHAKGAFTGANEEKQGLFEWANGGTVFLDEVGELSQPMQSKLLRVLENAEIQKVGSPQTRHVDVAVIAATSRDLRSEVKAGRFRSDLSYRLNLMEIQLPPLRERPEDIPLLTRHFIEMFNKQYGKQIRGLSLRAQKAIAAHSWPGNVRELHNAIGRGCLMAKGEFIDLDDLPPHWTHPEAAPQPGADSLDSAEKLVLQRILEQTTNKAMAARKLGISRSTLYRLMRRHNLEGEE